MIREITYNITKEEDGLTVGRFLKEKGYSQKLITALRQSKDGLTIDGSLVFTIHPLKAGDCLRVRMEETQKSEHVPAVEPAKMPEIVYEDEDILVVNKPVRMPSHPSMEHYEDTLGNAVMWYLKKSYGDAVTFRIINRLDKDTSGLTLIAKNRLSAGILSEAMVRREIHRTYHAMCQGKLTRSGTIIAPILREEGSVLKRVVDFENGERAITHYCPLRYDEKLQATEVALWLETGRTHQIRVHMLWLGYPLLGDFLYNPTDHTMRVQALHSYRLRFVHPITGKEMDFTCDVNWEERTCK